MEFTNTPPAACVGHSLTLVRTPIHGALKLCSTSHDLIGTATHWWKGRTMPCQKAACPACDAGVPWRWHGWLAALLAGSKEHVIFEMTAQAAEPLVAYKEANATLRGCILTAQRARQKTNGRVLITCCPGDLARLHLPAAPDLIAALCQIWNIPCPVQTTGQFSPERRARTFALADGNGHENA
jgi:hypothetical protein